MLLDFANQSHRSLSDAPSQSELLAILTARYEAEVARPLSSLIAGRLVQALLIQASARIRIHSSSGRFDEWIH